MLKHVIKGFSSAHQHNAIIKSAHWCNDDVAGYVLLGDDVARYILLRDDDVAGYISSGMTCISPLIDLAIFWFAIDIRGARGGHEVWLLR